MTTTMKRSDAVAHLRSQLGEYACEWEPGEPEPTRFTAMSLEDLEEAFCSSGVFNHVFDGTNVFEQDFSIVED